MKKDRILKNSLKGLLNKFAENDVIAALEKEYSAEPSSQIPASLIDDTPFIKKVKIPKETLDRFASSILKNGVFSPLIVRPKGNHYELVLGRKRFQGGKRAGLKEFPCVIIDESDEVVLLTLLADTRDQRESNVVEMALICQTLYTRFGYTQESLGKLSHQSRSQITNTLRILRLPDDILDDICLGKLSYGHAKAVASLSESEIRDLVKRVYEENLSVREVEAIARKEGGKNTTKSPKYSIKDHGKSLTITFESEEEKAKFLKRIAK